MTDKLHRENKPDQPLSILTLTHVPPDEERAEMGRQLDTALIIRFRESLSLANRVRMENPPGDWIEQPKRFLFAAQRILSISQLDSFG